MRPWRMSPLPETLRVLDFGRVSPLRSQTLWHAVAYGVSAGAPPTLSFARPDAPYVCVGYHRTLAEVDEDTCARNGWPVYRRMVGGGPVWLDDGQLFFQITVPVRSVSPFRAEAIRELLAPAVSAFRACGVDAALDESAEIVVGDQKICGHGAGQIEQAVVVCGNLIQSFDHTAATSALALPSAELREDVERLMRRYVAATPVDAEAFSSAAVSAYAAALGRSATHGRLTETERGKVAELDARFTDSAWRTGPERPARAVAQVKVRAGVWAFEATRQSSRAVISVVDGLVERARLTDPQLNGSTAAAQDALVGRPFDAAPAALARFGAGGSRLSALLALADGRSL